jgi:hypothetical protein
MRISKRVARKESIEHGFRSKFEFTFSKELKRLNLFAEYEPDKFKYKQPELIRSYCPDWKIRESVYIETKGNFSSSDRKKILWFRESNPDIKIYMLFMRSNNTLSKVSKTKYSDWCDKNNIEWADIKDIKKWKSWFR